MQTIFCGNYFMFIYVSDNPCHKKAKIPQEKCFHTISFFTKTTPTALETRHVVKNTGHISQLQTVGSIQTSFANKQFFIDKCNDLVYYILRFYPRNNRDSILTLQNFRNP